MKTGTKFQIEGLNPDGEWHLVGLNTLGVEGDHKTHMDHVARMLRDHGITRYSRLRLAKYVTTLEVVGEEITV